MKNMKRWKRLLAVGMCSAMMFSMSVGVSATENQDTDETVVEIEKELKIEEEDSASILTTSCVVNDNETTIMNNDISKNVEKDMTDSNAKEGENSIDSGEENGKTKITLSASYGSRSIDLDEEALPERNSDWSFLYLVTDRYAETVANMIDVELIEAVVSGYDGDIDISSAITMTDITSWTGAMSSQLYINFEWDLDLLRTLLADKAEEHCSGYIDISINCNDNSYELDIESCRYEISIYNIPRTEASSEYQVNDVVLSRTYMQELVEINKEKDIIINTPSGLSYMFKKGNFKLIGDKAEYDFNVSLITDFSNSGIKDTNVTSDIFACRINYAYNGQLPATALINIPVGSEWNGQTLYYYQVMEDGTLKDTGKSGKVENGIFDVFQSHCSDYVLLAKSPKELGVTENTDNDNNNNNNTGNGNNQTGNGNTQGSGNNSNPQVKPSDITKTSPKTGDNNMILLFAVLCAGSCVVGVSVLKARRKIR